MTLKQKAEKSKKVIRQAHRKFPAEKAGSVNQFLVGSWQLTKGTHSSYKLKVKN